MKILLILTAVIFLLVPGLSARSQDSGSGTHQKILQIHRDFVKAGKESEYAGLQFQAAAECVKENSPIPYLTVSSVSGQSETWFMIWYQSFDEIDKLSDEYLRRTGLAAELRRILQPKTDLVTGSENLLANYREDLSQGPELDIGKARFFSTTIVRVLPGRVHEFEEIQKIAKVAHTKAGTEDSHVVYQVVSGTANGTFLIINPIHAYSDLDETTRHGKKYNEALGEAGRLKLRELATVAISGSDTYLYAIRPRLSYPAEEWVNTDVDFWAEKPGVRR